MRRSTPSRLYPTSVQRVLVVSGAAVFVFCLLIVASAVRDAREASRLADDVKVRLRPLAETAYELEINVFELGAAAVNFVASRDTNELALVGKNRRELLEALGRHDSLSALAPYPSDAASERQLHVALLAYVALSDSLVAVARRSHVSLRTIEESSALRAFSEAQRALDVVLDTEIQPRAVARWHETADRARVGARRTALVISILAPLTLLIAAYASAVTARAYVRTRALHEEAQRVSQQKTEFASITAHELRSPLTAMLGSLRLMKSGRAGELPQTAAPYVEMASRSAVRLLNLINELLELDRIEAGMMAFHEDVVSAADIVRMSCDGLSGMASELNVRIDAQSRTDASVRGDPARLQQVLVNLLSNALKHAPTDTTVLVRADDAGARVRFSVRDFGPGIAPADRDRIFQRFVQTGSAHQHASTGLGLTIAREIVHRHGGSIGVDSVIGEGATFWFEIPKAARVSSAQVS